MSEPIKLWLYTKDECELCDKAMMMFRELCLQQPELAHRYAIDKVDITREQALIQRYGLKIPVLQRADSGDELEWPFPPSRLRSFLGT